MERKFWAFIYIAVALFALAACSVGSTLSVAPQTTPVGEDVGASHGDDHAHDAVELPALTPVPLSAGERLRIVATTSLIGDAVQRVAGDLVDLTVLIPPGSDPHSYVATPRDMIALDDAQVIFVNGLGLEESLIPTLDNLSNQPPVVSVNVGVEALVFEEGAEHEGEEHDAGEHHHEGVDPHTWQEIPNVMIWVENIGHVLGELDPVNATTYARTAASYHQELEQLDQEVRAALAVIPPEARKLVTEHDNLGYFARAYDFTVVGAVIPSFSTMASISAQEMVALQQQIAAEGVKAIFVGSTVNPKLAEQVAQDVGIPVTPLFTDSLSGPGGGAETYVEMMRSNANSIAGALKQNTP